MDKYEKVIKAYEICSDPMRKCVEDECPYEKICYHAHFCNKAVFDAVELLKEQDKTIGQLEEELARTDDMLRHYLNGNE